MADKLDPSDLLKAAFSGDVNKVLEVTNVSKSKRSLNKASIAASLNGTDKNGKTALHLAVDKDHVRAIQILVEAGADINFEGRYRYKGREMPPLVYAVYNNKTDCVRELLKLGADINLPGNGKTALIYAAEKYSIDILKMLLEAGAVIDQQDSSGMTALTRAARAGSIKCLRILMEAGAVIDQQDSTGMTALTYAARAGSSSCVHLLLDSGASVNIWDHKGKYPIHHLVVSNVAVNEWKLCLEMLLSQGISINAKDNDGMTPLMYAARFWESQDVMAMLLEHGAEVNALDNRGQTALIHVLIHNGDQRNIRFLLNNGAKFSIGRLATGSICTLAQLDFDWDLNELQIGNEVDLQVSWDDFACVIFSGNRRFLQFLVVCGLMPPQPIPESLPSRSYLSQSSTSMLEMAANERSLDLGLIKYLIAICYLRSNDFAFFTSRYSDHYTLSNKKEVNTLMEALRRQPWPLVKLCFVAVSREFGASPGRQERVKNSQLPPKLQRMLLFQEPWSRLCVHQWDKIPLTFTWEEYGKLSRPRPLLYHWPVGRSLVPCDCGKCDGTMYKYEHEEEESDDKKNWFLISE